MKFLILLLLILAWEAHAEDRLYSVKFDLDAQEQEYIRYAYEVGGKDFMLTLNAENQKWNPLARSKKRGANWYYDFGLCQLNYKYHKPFIISKNFKYPKSQIDYCYEVYQDWFRKKRENTTFYGYNIRFRYIYQFKNLP